MTAQAKRTEQEKRRNNYQEQKLLKCKLKLDFENKPVSNANDFSEKVKNIMEQATPRKKVALKDKGIIFTPRSKERYRLSTEVSEKENSGLERYSSSKKRDSRNFQRLLTKSLIGKSYHDHKLRKSLNIKWDYWARVSV